MNVVRYSPIKAVRVRARHYPLTAQDHPDYDALVSRLETLAVTASAGVPGERLLIQEEMAELHERIGQLAIVAAARYAHIDFKPPASAAAEARRGLEWRKKHGRGGTAVGVARARDISNGRSMSPATVRRMHSFFSRHEVDKKGQGWSPGDGYPSAGRIAWALWGGDAGAAWARKVVKQMKSADEK